MDPIVIKFDGGGSGLFGDVEAMADAVKDLQATAKEFRQAIADLNASGSKAANAIKKQTDAVKQATGPWQRQAKAVRDYNKALADGNALAMKDAHYNLQRANRAVANANKYLNPKPKTPSDLFEDMIQTSRVAIGPNGKLQLMPLVNRMMRAGLNPDTGGGILDLTKMMSGLNTVKSGASAAGAGEMGAMAGAAGSASASLLAVAGAAAIVVGAIALMAAAFKTAMGELRKGMDLYWSGGGSLGQTSRLMWQSGLLGVDPNSLIGSAKGLGSGGLGDYLARQAGINPYNSWFGYGDQNFTGKAMKMVDFILNTKSDRTARMAADQWGMDSVMWARWASPGAKADLTRSINNQLTPEAMQQAADAQIRLNETMMEFKKLMTDLGILIIPIVNWALRQVLAIMKFLGSNPYPGLTGTQYDYNPKGQTEKVKNALDRNTDAVNANTQAINGMYGISSKGRGVIPSAWGPGTFDQLARGQAVAMGAFNL